MRAHFDKYPVNIPKHWQPPVIPYYTAKYSSRLPPIYLKKQPKSQKISSKIPLKNPPQKSPSGGFLGGFLFPPPQPSTSLKNSPPRGGNVALLYCRGPSTVLSVGSIKKVDFFYKNFFSFNPFTKLLIPVDASTPSASFGAIFKDIIKNWRKNRKKTLLNFLGIFPFKGYIYK